MLETKSKLKRFEQRLIGHYYYKAIPPDDPDCKWKPEKKAG